MARLLGIFVAALHLAAASGCATATLIVKATGTEKDFASHIATDWTPTGPRVETLRLDLEYLPPPPAPPAVAVPVPSDVPRTVVVLLPPPPGPGPVVLPPVPPPPFPPPPPLTLPPVVEAPEPVGEVRVVCRQESRVTRAHYRSERVLYDAGHKLLIGFFGLGETVLSAFSFGVSRLDGGGTDKAAIATGVLMGLDALGTWALLAHPKTKWLVEEDGPGPVETRDGCPEGLAIDVDGLRSGVAPDGTVHPEVAEHLVAAMLERGGRFSFSAEGVARDVQPSQAQRCRFAERGHLPAPERCPVFWAIPEQGWALELRSTAAASR